MLALTNLIGFGVAEGVPVNGASSITMDPADFSGVTFSGGNLIVTGPAAAWGECRSTSAGKSAGKWQWEVTCGGSIGAGEQFVCGIKTTTGTETSIHWYSASYVAGTYGTVYGVQDNDQKVTNATRSAFTTGLVAGSVITFLLDMDAGTLIVKVNGVNKGTVYSGISGTFEPACSIYSNSTTATFKFGQLTYPEAGYSNLQS